MAGQDVRFQQNKPRNRKWMPLLLILFGIYVINNYFALIAFVVLALVVAFISLRFVLPALLSMLGESSDLSSTDAMQRGLAWLNTSIHDMLVPKYGPPFSTTQGQGANATSNPVAENAMSRAGWSLDHKVWLSDVGLLTYQGTKAILHRTSAIPDNVNHIRPFIVLDVPWNIMTRDLEEYGGVRFNLIDHQGKLCFTARKRYVLKVGQNFLTPDTWLRVANDTQGSVHNNSVTGEWELQVLAGQSVIAEHTFGWRQVADAAPLTADGEVNEQAREWLDDESDEPVSLADLMAEQAQNERTPRWASQSGAR